MINMTNMKNRYKPRILSFIKKMYHNVLVIQDLRLENEVFILAMVNKVILII